LVFDYIVAGCKSFRMLHRINKWIFVADLLCKPQPYLAEDYVACFQTAKKKAPRCRGALKVLAIPRAVLEPESW
jgi:hypothetical protein